MSDIWKYYDKSSTDEAQCQIFKKKVGRKEGSTRGMWKHLEAKHQQDFKQVKGTLNKRENEEEQRSILNFVTPKKNEQGEAEEQMARIMLRQNNSFLFFEDQDLKALYKKAHPNLELGGRDHFRRKVIPRMFEEICDKIKSGVGSEFYAITSDGWSKPTLSPQLQSVTIHWTDTNWNRQDMVFAAFPMDGFRHSGDVLAEKISACLTKNGISMGKLVCCVRDDARNMQSAIRRMEKDSFQCCAHFLNLVVEDALKTDGLAEIITKAREWTKECRKPKMRQCLHRHQEQLNVTKKQLVMSVPTRWNSVYRMLSAFKEQKKVLLSMQFERDQRTLSLPKRPRLGYETIPPLLPQLTASDFEILRYLCPILQIFDVETQKFSREKSTASVILPTLKRICDFLKEEGSVPQILHMFIDNLVCSLNRRVEKLIHNNLLRVCTLLDPRFAYDEEIFSKANWALIEEDVQEFAKRIDNENEFQLEEAGTSSLGDVYDLADDCEERSDDSIKFDIWKPKSPASISLPSAISTTSRIQVQLAAFKVDARPPLDTDIFSWWKQNGAQFPALDKIARVVHCIPATSVSSERLFSRAGLIYGNKLRNRLSGALVEKILVVKANMDSLQLAPSTAPEEKDIFESDDDNEVEDQEDQQYVLPEN